MAVDVEFASEQAEKSFAPGRIERQIGAPEIGCAGASRDFATTAVETTQHLLAQPVGVVSRGLRTRHSGQNASGRLGDFAPRAAQISQGAVKDALEETG